MADDKRRDLTGQHVGTSRHGYSQLISAQRILNGLSNYSGSDSGQVNFYGTISNAT